MSSFQTAEKKNKQKQNVDQKMKIWLREEMGEQYEKLI